MTACRHCASPTIDRAGSDETGLRGTYCHACVDLAVMGAGCDDCGHVPGKLPRDAPEGCPPRSCRCVDCYPAWLAAL